MNVTFLQLGPWQISLLIKGYYFGLVLGATNKPKSWDRLFMRLTTFSFGDEICFDALSLNLILAILKFKITKSDSEINLWFY